jgi:hypothetical protein
MLTKRCSVHVPFPLWQYLTQPISSSARVILNPLQFQYHYHVQLLEHCWECDSIQLLERCWLKELELNTFSR